MIPPCPDWVDPQPFRTHVRNLICQTGLSWRLVAAHAGVAPRALHALLHGRRGGQIRRLHVSTARALAATSVESIADAETTTTDIRPVRALTDSLTRLGFSRDDLRRHLTDDDLDRLAAPTVLSCSEATRARATACYDLLTCPTGRGQRAAGPTPQGSHVVCSQHAMLDRKQTSWPTGCTSLSSALSRP